MMRSIAARASIGEKRTHYLVHFVSLHRTNFGRRFVNTESGVRELVPNACKLRKTAFSEDNALAKQRSDFNWNGGLT
jgi:hypothetical protein